MGSSQSSQNPLEVSLVPQNPPSWHHVFPALPIPTTKLRYENVEGEFKVFDHTTERLLFKVLKNQGVRIGDMQVVNAQNKLVANLLKRDKKFHVHVPSSRAHRGKSFAIDARMLMSEVRMKCALLRDTKTGTTDALVFDMEGNWPLHNAIVVWQTQATHHGARQDKKQSSPRDPICKIALDCEGYNVEIAPGVDTTLMALFCIVLDEVVQGPSAAGRRAMNGETVGGSAMVAMAEVPPINTFSCV